MHKKMVFQRTASLCLRTFLLYWKVVLKETPLLSMGSCSKNTFTATQW